MQPPFVGFHGDFMALKLQYLKIEKTKKIKLKGDGINVEYFEKAAFVLYWDKGSFKRIQTSD